MPGRTLDILVVDDNPILVSILSDIFTEHGCCVRTAHDGSKALAELKARLPDVLVSDLNMPNMSGFELLSVVRRRFDSVAVIAMSGAYSGRDVPPGVAADAFYAKGSSSVARLVEIVHGFKDRRALQRERTHAPIWIPTLAASEQTWVYVACAECLRTASHSLSQTDGLPDHSSCPHCSLPFEFALAKSYPGLDLTLLPTRPHTTSLHRP